MYMHMILTYVDMYIVISKNKFHFIVPIYTYVAMYTQYPNVKTSKHELIYFWTAFC